MQVKEMLHTTYFRIRRYATGDPVALCRFPHGGDSMAHRYRDDIIALLEKGAILKDALEHLKALGYTGKRTAFEVYCRRLIAEMGLPYTKRRGMSRQPLPAKLKMHFLTASNVLRYLWSGAAMEASDYEFVLQNYPSVRVVHQCVLDFRTLFREKSSEKLEQFVIMYTNVPVKPLCSFISGLKGDLEAVRNAVLFDDSNGYVEGVNNKIKLIKRSMFGRAKIDLLRVKVLFAQ